MTSTRSATSSGILLCLAVACGGPVHPSNPAIPDEACQPRCQRDHQCGPAVDVTECMNRCKAGLSQRVIYYSPAYVSRLRDCAFQQACTADTDRAIAACWDHTAAGYVATETTRKFCLQMEQRDRYCAMGSEGFEHCLYGHKRYSDAILSQMISCVEDHPCKSYRACLRAIVGPDVVNDDPDRRKQFEERAVPTARSRVRVAGKVTTIDTSSSVAQAKVCVHDHPEIACVTTADDGAYTIEVPARAEIALAVTAAGHAGRLVGIVTPSNDWNDFGLPLTKSATVEARDSAAGGRHPDEGTGTIFATARAPKGSKVGLEGVTMSLAPASPRPAVFFDPSGALDTARTATSTYSSGLFLNVPAGVFEMTFGPESSTCTPSYGGWPSPKPNTVRVPVVAGLETRVVLACSR